MKTNMGLKAIKTIYKFLGLGDLKKDVEQFIKERDVPYYLFQMKNHLLGKNFAIIGPTGAGKSTFLDVLRNPDIDIDTSSYHGTELESFDAFKAKYKLYLEELDVEINLSFRVTGRYDVGGDFVEQHWPKVLKNADFVVYVASIEEIMGEHSEEYISAIVKDFEFILEKYQTLNPNAKIVIAYNKIDVLADVYNLEQEMMKIQPKILAITERIKLCWGQKARLVCPPVMLSLADKKIRSRTMDDLFINFVNDHIKAEKSRHKYSKKAS